MNAKPEHYDLIKKPIITEKATMASEAGAVVFQVAGDASKPEIKAAVEGLEDPRHEPPWFDDDHIVREEVLRIVDEKP